MGGMLFAAIGGFGTLIGWVKGPREFLLFGPAFVMAGAAFLLFGKTRTHRLERWRGMLAIDSRNILGLRSRELPLDSIADIVVEKVRSARSAPSYYVYYVTRQGERIIWTGTYDGSKQNTLECMRAARRFLGMPEIPMPDGEPERE